MSADSNGVAERIDLLRNCPTRLSDGPALIAHRIAGSECQKRQRELFHKCWTCAFANRLAGTAVRLAAEAALLNGRSGSNGVNGFHKNGDSDHNHADAKPRGDK